MRIFYFGCWNEAGHFLFSPDRRRARHDCPFEDHHLDGGILLPRPERVGIGSLVSLRGWTILSWWGGNPWDKRGAVNQAVMVEGEGHSLDDVWQAFHACFPNLAEKFSCPELVNS